MLPRHVVEMLVERRLRTRWSRPDDPVFASSASGQWVWPNNIRTRLRDATDGERFRNDWERAASLMLRHGDPQAITRYADQNRIAEGGDADMQQAAYHAWRADVRAGKRSLLIASDNATVAALTPAPGWTASSRVRWSPGECGCTIPPTLPSATTLSPA
jgi:hypothetical protein